MKEDITDDRIRAIEPINYIVIMLNNIDRK